MIIHKENKFKSVFISVRFKEEITKNNVGLRALLPNVMSSSTKTYNKRESLNQALESLYGASVSAITYKTGKLSIVDFTLNIINPKFMDDGFFNEGVKILYEIIFGHKNLPKKDFEIEKRLIIEKADALKNNKTAYALDRLLKNMFSGERYGISARGEKPDFLSITYDELNKYYKSFLEHDYDVVISGDINDDIINTVESYFKPKNTKFLIPIEEEKHYTKELKVINEKDKISQAKVNIGYNFPVLYNEKLYYASVLFNLIFGASTQSRLFLTVREKHSLCYYINTIYDSFKGVLLLYTGVDKDKVDFTLKLIASELKDLQEKAIKEQELNSFKKELIDNMKKRADSQSSSSVAKYLDTLLNNEKSLEEKIRLCNEVSVNDILEVANKVIIDTIYVLNPEDANGL